MLDVWLRALVPMDRIKDQRLRLTCVKIPKEKKKRNQKQDHDSFPQAPQIPNYAIESPRDLVTLRPSSPKLFLVAMVEGQARRYFAKVLAKETLASSSESRVAFDLGTPGLSRCPSDIV